MRLLGLMWREWFAPSLLPGSPDGEPPEMCGYSEVFTKGTASV